MSPSGFPGSLAIIDVETTGLFPFRHDRIVEIAVVVLDDRGHVAREYVSLVNPKRDIGPTSVHGISAEDVGRAPEFGEIVGPLCEVLNGSIAIVGHNVRFDRDFVTCEFSRAGIVLPSLPVLCTMQLSGGGNLADCCADYGVAFDGEHHEALCDARAAAGLLKAVAAEDPQVLSHLVGTPPIRWPEPAPARRAATSRQEARRRQAEPPSYLQRLLGRMSGIEDALADDSAVMAYGALLDRVLEDRRVDDSEAEALVEMAERWGLSGEQIEFAHHAYLHQLAAAALADGVVTAAEHRELLLVARLLGQDKGNLEDLLRDAAHKLGGTRSESPAQQEGDGRLTGKRVCFTGELQCVFRGERITRGMAERLATEAGLIVANSVTKKLDVLVIADPHSQSGKATKARRYGTRILHEPVFWKSIGVEVK